ncbi:MAG: tryptophan synthase subunit alpha [candidate division Zixibacteria bacterium]
MKTAISKILEKPEGRKVLVPYLTCGFPDMNNFERLALSVCDAGIDMIEIGLPFSDPLADGPTIQYSSRTALDNGFTIEKGFASIGRIAGKVSLPIIIMTYLNTVRAMGEKRFLRQCRKAGVSGLVIPDLPADLSDDIGRACRESCIDLALLVAPTTPVERIKKIAEQSKGFLYLVSVKGTTGKRNHFPPGTLSFIKRVKKLSPVPVLVGFGISSPSMAAEAARFSDGVIIGSALIEIIRCNGNLSEASRKLKLFLQSVEKEMNS